MILESKFNIGDKVYSVSCVCCLYPKIHTPCEVCDSTGKITVKGKKYTCPECGGGYKEDYNNPKYYFPYPQNKTLTIGQIGLKMTKDKKEITYMCKETGVGSGTVYYENRLFSTYEKALNFVENANEQLKNGKHWSEIP